MEVPYEFAATKTGFSLQKSSPYLPLFNHHIIRLQEKGILDRIIKKYTPQPRDCGTSSANAIGYESCFSAFLPLIFGYLFGILILIFENYWKKKKDQSESSRKISKSQFIRLVRDYNARLAELKLLHEHIIKKSQILELNTYHETLN